MTKASLKCKVIDAVWYRDQVKEKNNHMLF